MGVDMHKQETSLNGETSAKSPLDPIKILIWMYVVLLLTEGALRKWFLPGLSNPLLIIRDPVVVVIYVLAVMRGVFPQNGFMMMVGGLAIASVVSSFLGGLDNALVIIYGLRINYFHLPLIWIMGAVLNRRDVERLGMFLLLAAIPMTLLMVQQFRSSPDAWVNRGVGGDEGGQIFGADGRIRPPGLFAFISGPQIFFPFCAAFFCDQLSGHGRMKWPLLIGCGVAIIVALPVSISRTVMLATAIVGAVFVITAPFVSGGANKMLRPLLLLGLLGLVVTRLPIFHEGNAVFKIRWETAATATDGDAWADVADRIISTVVNPYYYAVDSSLFGRGIGVGSNVGSRILTGQVGFLLAEEEIGKIYGELGLLVGTAFILFRIALTVHLGIRALRHLQEFKDALPLLLYSATCVSLVSGQWAPPVILGFSVVGAGLILGAMNPVADTQTPAPPTPVSRPLRDLHRAGLPLASRHRPPFLPK